jgi:F0F1-type ATP synthase assembly protein I
VVQNRGAAVVGAMLTGVGFGLLLTKSGSSSPRRMPISFSLGASAGRVRRRLALRCGYGRCC